MAAAATTLPPPLLHDPFAPHRPSFSTGEAGTFLSLLAVDEAIDSRAPIAPDAALLNDLRAVDLAFERVDAREGPEEGRDVFLDLLRTDREVDGATGRATGEGGTSTALHDPYARREFGELDPFAGRLYGLHGEGSERRLKDDATMMHLLAVDEGIDDTKRHAKLVASDDSTIIGELHAVDLEVGGAQRRALLVEDLQGMLDVDRLVDGKDKRAAEGGRRNIFSAKEKYKAKLASPKSNAPSKRL